MPAADEGDLKRSVPRRRSFSFRPTALDHTDVPRRGPHARSCLPSPAAPPAACHCRSHRTFFFLLARFLYTSPFFPKLALIDFFVHFTLPKCEKEREHLSRT